MAWPADWKKIRREQVLGAELGELVPLVQLYLDKTAEELLEEFKSHQQQLVILSQALVLKFVNEYFRMDEQCRMHDPHQAKSSSTVQQPSSAEESLAKAREHMATQIVRNKLPQRYDSLHIASRVIQSAWRMCLARQRLRRDLLSIVFEEPATPNSRLHLSGGPASWLRQQRSHIVCSDSISEAVHSVRAVRRMVAKVNSKLKQHGLDLVTAFRCADTSYPEGSAVMPVGQYIKFLLQDQHVPLTVAEQMLFARLFQVAGSSPQGLQGLQGLPSYAQLAKGSAEVLDPRNRQDAKCASESGGGAAGGGNLILREAWRLQMPYVHALELSHAFQDSSELSVQRTPWKAPLLAVRDALLQAEEVGLRWGRCRPSWRGLLLDAHVSRLLEEHARLKAVADEARGEESKVSEAGHQLEVCAAQLSAAGMPGASPRVAVPLVIARLLQEGLNGIAPVTIHAAIHQASEPSCERRVGLARLHLVSDTGRRASDCYVDFDAPLPAPPCLVHLQRKGGEAEVREERFEFDLESLSARGMRLRLRPRDAQRCTRGWASQLRVGYVAGAAKGTVRASSAGCVEVNFVPHLARTPPYVLVETFQSPRSSLLRMGLLVKRPTVRGFTVELPVSASITSEEFIWYDAAAAEPVVTASTLQDLAELPCVPEVAEGVVAKVLPEVSSTLRLQDSSHYLTDGAHAEADEEEGEDEEEEDELGDLGELDEGDAQFEAIKSRLNRRAHHWLHVTGKAARPADEAVATPAPTLSASAPPARAEGAGLAGAAKPPTVAAAQAADPTPKAFSVVHQAAPAAHYPHTEISFFGSPRSSASVNPA